MNINLETILKVNKILEHDKLESSYKLALLKSLILTIKKFDHHITQKENYVKIPFYFLVEEWFFYYLPFVYLNIPQHKSSSLTLNSPITRLYQEIFSSYQSSCKKSDWKCVYSLIYKEYYHFNLDTTKLFKELRKLIIQNPMKYMGSSHYDFFPKEKITPLKKIEKIDRRVFNNFGSFEIEEEFYKVLKYLGDNCYGLNTIIFKWEKLLHKVSSFSEFNFIHDILTHNIQEIQRDTNEVRKALNNKSIYCVWSGKKLHNFDIDHLLPFSLLFNNDYWNLLPTHPSINNKKSDKIPSPALIEQSSTRIKEYWELYKEYFPLFEAQRKIALGDFPKENDYITQLQKKSQFLIHTLGYDSFELEYAL